jgi:DNA-binding CsgD family transcriptional regulator
VSQLAEEAPSRAGNSLFGVAAKEQERMDMLLQPNVKTYADAAKRLGVTENAVKQTMARVLFRYRKAKMFCNQIEQYKRKRRENKRGHPRGGR